MFLERWLHDNAGDGAALEPGGACQFVVTELWMSAPLGQCSIVSLPVDSFFLCFILIMSVYLSARSTSLPQTHRCLLQNPRCPPCPVWDLVALLRGGCLHCHALVTLDSIHLSSLIEQHWMQIFYPPATNCSFPKCKKNQTRKQGWSGAVRVSVAPVGHMANPSALLSPRQKKLCRTWGKRVLNKLLLSLYVAEPELKCLVVLCKWSRI